MNWKNSEETKTDLFLIIGLVIIVFGVSKAFNFSASTLIISGIIVAGIGASRALKKMRKQKK